MSPKISEISILFSYQKSTKYCTLVPDIIINLCKTTYVIEKKSLVNFTSTNTVFKKISKTNKTGGHF